MSQNLEKPHRSMAQHAIKEDMIYKECTPPASNKAIQIQMLAHQAFAKNLTKFLRGNFIRPNLRTCTPLHIPTAAVIEKAHPSIASQLFNDRTWSNAFAIATPTTCSCQKWLQMDPNIPNYQGHITSPISLLPLHPQFK